MDIKQAAQVEQIKKGTPFVSFYVDDDILWAGYMVVVPPEGSTIALQGFSAPRKVKSVVWGIVDEGVYVSVTLETGKP